MKHYLDFFILRYKKCCFLFIITFLLLGMHQVVVAKHDHLVDKVLYFDKNNVVQYFILDTTNKVDNSEAEDLMITSADALTDKEVKLLDTIVGQVTKNTTQIDKTELYQSIKETIISDSALVNLTEDLIKEEEEKRLEVEKVKKKNQASINSNNLVANTASIKDKTNNLKPNKTNQSAKSNVDDGNRDTSTSNAQGTMDELTVSNTVGSQTSNQQKVSYQNYYKFQSQVASNNPANAVKKLGYGDSSKVVVVKLNPSNRKNYRIVSNDYQAPLEYNKNGQHVGNDNPSNHPVKGYKNNGNNNQDDKNNVVDNNNDAPVYDVNGKLLSRRDNLMNQNKQKRTNQTVSTFDKRNKKLGDNKNSNTSTYASIVNGLKSSGTKNINETNKLLPPSDKLFQLFFNHITIDFF